jgi:hypothetical protein
MSGILNVLIASVQSGPAPVGLLASIRNPANGNLDNPKIAMRNDQLNLVVNTADGVPEIRKLITARLGLDLTFTWQRSLSNDVNYLYGNDIVIDSAGNVIVAGSLFVSASGFNTPYVVKFNSGGTLQWQRRIAASAVYTAAAVDSSDNIYVVGYSTFFVSNRYDIYAVKYSTNATIQYQRLVGDTGTFRNELAYSVAVPNSTLFAVAGEADPANTDGLLWFLNQSDGTTAGATTQRDAAGAGIQQGISVIKGETNDVLYYAIRSYATLSLASKCVQVVIKWTATGGFVWQRYFEDSSTSSSSIFVHSMAMSADNTAVYVVASTWNSQVQITKWGIDGSLLWQRGVDSPTALLSVPDIAVDSLDNIYVSFTSFDSSLSGGTRAMVLKMPGSGAGSGNSAVLEGVEYDYITTTRVGYADALLISTLTRPNSSITQTESTPTPTDLAGALALTNAPF